MDIVQLCEIGMLVAFGFSWPFNIAKSWRSRTAKGKSVMFEFIVVFGYLVGLLGKLITYSRTGVWAYSIWFYFADIAMVAIHPSLITDDPEAYLADKGYAMPFATDGDDAVLNIVGGTGVYPQTVVLNRRGEVIYNEVGSVTAELLDALYEQASE